jgi:tRNA-specific 2-thiouridylase
LAFVRFPLGGLPKPEVRKVATSLGLAVADKPDSQDICFVPEGKYVTLIDRLRPQGALPGEIVHLDGRVLGQHEGVSRYTVGQRRGLNVAVGEPLFVVKINPDQRQVVVGPREALLTRALRLKETNWLGDQASLLEAAKAGQPVLARVRSTREPVAARLAIVDGAPAVLFDEAEEGVSPGQACVLYDPVSGGERVLGGGFIESTTAAHLSL